MHPGGQQHGLVFVLDLQLLHAVMSLHGCQTVKCVKLDNNEQCCLNMKVNADVAFPEAVMKNCCCSYW